MPRAKSAKSAGKSAAKATKKRATKSANKKAAKSSTNSGKKSLGSAAATKATLTANATLNVVTNGMRTPPPRRKFKYSKRFDPGSPTNPPQFNINYVRVTAVSGGAVPDPGALGKVTIEHGGLTAHLLDYAFTDSTKKTLIIWFFVWKPAKAKYVSLADLVVTIDSTDEGTDPQVRAEDP